MRLVRKLARERRGYNIWRRERDFLAEFRRPSHFGVGECLQL